MCEVWLASRLRSDFKISSNQVLQSLDRELNILGSSFGLVCFPFASYAGVDLGGGGRGCAPHAPRDDLPLSHTTGILPKKILGGLLVLK